MIDKSDLKMRFLFGEDYSYNGLFTLYSLKLYELLDIGYNNYNEAIGMLCITKNDIEEIFDYELEREIEPFEFIFQNCMYGDEDIRRKILSSFELFLKEPVSICEQGYFFIGEIEENRYITEFNYNEIISILKEQNCVETKKKVKPKNKAQKAYFLKRKKAEAMKKKRGDKPDNSIHHIISSVCAKHSSYNLLNIKKLTMYQLIDQYKRIHAIDDYFITINGMIHGASSEDSKLKHWSEPLE